MSKVIYEAPEPRYAVQEQLYLHDTWATYRGFSDQDEAIIEANELKALYPKNRFQVVDKKED